MTKDDLLRIILSAEMLTIAAKRHEDGLKAILAIPDLPEIEDRLIGDLFSPLSQELANWRNLMAAMFPTPDEDPQQMADLEKIVDSWK